jgi:dihydrolipoamide dehydrogenase
MKLLMTEKIAGSNAASWPEVLTYARRAPLNIVFSDPQIAVVGMSHQALIKANIDYAIGEVDWGSQGRARLAGVNRGLLRVYGDKKTGKLLGAEMVGPRAEHMAHLLAWCVQLQLSAGQILELPFYHPVFEEGLRTAIRELNHNLDISGGR